jgi:hypothetical protein
LAEALIAVLLTAVLLHVAWTIAARHTRAVLELIRRAEVLEAGRITGWVLRSELQPSRPGTDWHAAEDGLTARVFRSLAVPCPDSSGPGVLVARLDGLRAPDVAKDSLLLLEPDGRWRGYRVERVGRGGECAGEPMMRLELDDPTAGGYAARLYEHGSYHLVDGALRYRRGRGGRQPLTPRSLGPASTLTVDSWFGVTATITPATHTAGSAWTRSLRILPPPGSP